MNSSQCPNTPSGDSVSPIGCAQADVDPDADGICSPGAVYDSQWCAVVPGTVTVIRDNCPSVFNPDQADVNKNGVGDACEGLDA